MTTRTPYTLAEFGLDPDDGGRVPWDRVNALTIDERVDLGVEWLNRHLPDWPWHVDPERLDLGSACRCVLGQLVVDYHPTADAENVDVLQKYAEIDHHLLEAAVIPLDWDDAFGAWMAEAVLIPVPSVTREWAQALGFLARSQEPGSFASWGEEYEPLTVAWQAKLIELRQIVPPGTAGTG